MTVGHYGKHEKRSLGPFLSRCAGMHLLRRQSKGTAKLRAMIENIDRCIGEILEAVKAARRLGKYDCGLRSDHGEMMGS